MAKRLQLRGGTTAQHSSFTGAVREVTVDTDKDTLVVHDGTTAGGIPLAKSSETDLVNDTTPQLGGDLSTNGNDINFTDNDRAYFGTGNDLEIYHDGNNSYIKETGTGNLNFQSNGTEIQLSKTPYEHMIRAIPDGAVKLYHDNSEKLETTSSGATVFGTMTATSFSGDGSGLSGVTSVGGATGVDFNDDVKARFGTGNDLEIFHNDSGSFIKDVGTSNLFIDTDGNAIEVTSGNTAESMARFVKDGSVELYYDNSKKFETTSTGIDVTGNIEPGANDTYDLGASGNVWRNIYTGDLHLSNEAKSEGNSVDGTKGNWTIQEGSDDLFIVNNKSGKKYKFKLEEI